MRAPTVSIVWEPNLCSTSGTQAGTHAKRTPKWHTKNTLVLTELLKLSFVSQTVSHSEWSELLKFSLDSQTVFHRSWWSECWRCHNSWTKRHHDNVNNNTSTSALRDLPHLYHEACIRYWNNGPARSFLGMIYWCTSIYLSYKKRRYCIKEDAPAFVKASMWLSLLQIHSLSLPEEKVEDQTIILNCNITTITSGNHQCHSIKHGHISFH